MPEKSKRIIIRDLPGFADIEAKVRLFYNPNLPTPPYLDHFIDAVSLKTFGTVENEVWEEYGRHVGDGEDEYVEEEDLPQAVQHFIAAGVHIEKSDEDAVNILRALGVDFRDERGWPLLCTRFFKWQALAAVARIKGVLPDIEEAGLSKLASSLEDEVARFMKAKGAA